MKKIILTFLSAAALTAGLVVAPATVTPTETANAWVAGGGCQTATMLRNPNWRVTLYPWGTKHYFYDGQQAIDWLHAVDSRRGELHKRVGTYNSLGQCITHWQWKYVDNDPYN
jgi:hypothetical protein